MNMIIHNKESFDRWLPNKTTAVFDTYWKFAVERQSIFFHKISGNAWRLTEDPILQSYKFTNAYRASDRVSQYLIREVIYSGRFDLNDVFFRIILFKTFNKISTWELLIAEVGPITYRDYSYKKYDSVLTKARDKGLSIYSAAYIMPSGAGSFGYRYKHQNHLKLIEKMMRDEVPKRICDSKSLQHVFQILRSYPLIGDFLAYQYAIDINYSELINFNENSFVVPGPGAKDGIRKCFSDYGGLSEVDIIKCMVDRQDQEFERLGLIFRNLWGRPLHLIDCQNLFCEVDKYSRIAHPDIAGLTGRTRIKHKYKSTPSPIDYFYPPKWGINGAVKQSMQDLKQHRP